MPSTYLYLKDRIETPNGIYEVSTVETKREHFERAYRRDNQHWVDLGRCKGNQKARENHQRTIDLLSEGNEFFLN